MKFLVDQNLPTALATRLDTEGHEAQHTRDLGFERTPDQDLFEWCRQNDAVLLTADKRLTKYLAEQQATDPSVVILRGYLLDLQQLEADLIASSHSHAGDHGSAEFTNAVQMDSLTSASNEPGSLRTSPAASAARSRFST